MVVLRFFTARALDAQWDYSGPEDIIHYSYQYPGKCYLIVLNPMLGVVITGD